MGTWSPLGAIKMFWNYIEGVVAQNATELHTLKWLILCYLNFTSVEKNIYIYDSCMTPGSNVFALLT